MSDTPSTNGYTPRKTVQEQLHEARDLLRLERTKAELTALKANHFTASRQLHDLFSGGSELQEGYDGYTGNEWGSFVDPGDAFRDTLSGYGGGLLVDRGQARRDGSFRPFLWSDIDLDMQRSAARYVATKNRFGIGVLENLQNYVIGTGFKYEEHPLPDLDESCQAVAEPLARHLGRMLKEFRRVNNWPARERSCLLRGVRDGEVFVRHFPQPDGTTWVRFVEPEQIYQPLGSPEEWKWGLLHAPGDMERILAASVAYTSPNDYEDVPFADDNMMMLKRNTDECVKRGLSDIYSTGEALDGVQKLLRNMLVAGGVQAAIAWIEQFSGPNAASVQASIAATRDTGRPNNANQITGKSANYTRYEAGSIPKVGAGKEYVPPPVPVGSSAHIQIEAAGLRSIGVRWGMSEYMVSGDASNTNFANALAAGSPFVKVAESQQAVYWGPFFVRSHWVAVRNWCNAGKCRVNGRTFTFDEVKELIDIHATPPQVAIASERDEAEIDHQDLQDGVASVQLIRAKRGYDDARVRADLKAEPVVLQKPEQLVQTETGQLHPDQGKAPIKPTGSHPPNGDPANPIEAARKAVEADVRESLTRVEATHGAAAAKAVILATADLLKGERPSLFAPLPTRAT